MKLPDITKKQKSRVTLSTTKIKLWALWQEWWEDKNFSLGKIWDDIRTNWGIKLKENWRNVELFTNKNNNYYYTYPCMGFIYNTQEDTLPKLKEYQIVYIELTDLKKVIATIVTHVEKM